MQGGDEEAPKDLPPDRPVLRGVRPARQGSRPTGIGEHHAAEALALNGTDAIRPQGVPCPGGASHSRNPSTRSLFRALPQTNLTSPSERGTRLDARPQTRGRGHMSNLLRRSRPAEQGESGPLGAQAGRRDAARSENLTSGRCPHDPAHSAPAAASWSSVCRSALPVRNRSIWSVPTKRASLVVSPVRETWASCWLESSTPSASMSSASSWS